MSPKIRNEDLPASPPKKRKLKHPRTAKACTFCRRRKVRCSGTHPCDYCKREGVKCSYEDDPIRPSDRDSLVDLRASASVQYSPQDSSSLQRECLALTTSSNSTLQPSLQNTVDLPQAFAEGQLIGPSSGVSLLYHLNEVSKAGEGVTLPSASLMTHGDIPQAVSASVNAFRLPASDEVNGLLERYFRFAMPTYRFLHRPTLERWASELADREGKSLPKTASRSACVLLACAQALLYTSHGDRYLDGGDVELRLSRQYYTKAKNLLDQEPGPADLSSVQVRLAMCLYLLSTFRITECRFCFGITNTVLTALGLHRQASSPNRLELVEIESRRRTFWCAYVLDVYLSVMLGRPRLFRDEDIDQPFPRNFDDQDLMSSESAEELPLHGNLEAFVAHINLAKLMARNNDLLYPLETLSEEQIITRATEMIASIHSWRDSLPDFLKPREKTLAGQRTFERQNTVLKLAYAHLSILATRRCLLIDFSRIACLGQFLDQQARSGIRECALHITTIISAAHELLKRGGLYQAFWYTHYISLVAISTLYVLLIQDSSMLVPGHSVQAVASEVNLASLFQKAKTCQRRLADLAPEGSQAHRHHRLLDQLRAKCERDMMKVRRSAPSGQSAPHVSDYTGDLDVPQPIQHQHSGVSMPIESSHQLFLEVSLSDTNRYSVNAETFPVPPETGPNTLGDCSVFPTPFTPSGEDEAYHELLGWGWEGLDILGFPTNPSFDDNIFQP